MIWVVAVVWLLTLVAAFALGIWKGKKAVQAVTSIADSAAELAKKAGVQ